MAGPPVAARRRVDAVLDQIARDVAGLPDAYVRQLAPVMAEARRELVADLEGWLANVKDADERFTAQRYREALLQLDTALETIRSRVPEEVAGILGEQGDAAAAMAMANLKKQVVMHADHFGGEMRALPVRTSSLMERGAALLMPRYRSTLERYGMEGIGLIQRQLAIGMFRGETFAEMTNRLLRRAGGKVLRQGWPLEAAAEKIGEGFARALRSNAERIVRTEGINAYNAITDAGIDDLEADDPGWQKKWDASQDRRTCKVCRALDGVVVSPAGSVVYDLPSATRTPEEKRARMIENSLEADRYGDGFFLHGFSDKEVRDVMKKEGVPGADAFVGSHQDAIGEIKRHAFQKLQDADAAIERGDVRPMPSIKEVDDYRAKMEGSARSVSRAAREIDAVQREVLEEIREINALHKKVDGEDGEGDAIEIDDEEAYASFAAKSLQGSRGLSRAAAGEKLTLRDQNIEDDTLEEYKELFGNSEGDAAEDEQVRISKEDADASIDEINERVTRLRAKLPGLAEAQVATRKMLGELDFEDPDDIDADLFEDVLDEMVVPSKPDDDDVAARDRYDSARSAARTLVARERARLQELARQFDFEEAENFGEEAEKETKRLIKKLAKYKAPKYVPPDEDDE